MLKAPRKKQKNARKKVFLVKLNRSSRAFQLHGISMKRLRENLMSRFWLNFQEPQCLRLHGIKFAQPVERRPARVRDHLVRLPLATTQVCQQRPKALHRAPVVACVVFFSRADAEALSLPERTRWPTETIAPPEWPPPPGVRGSTERHRSAQSTRRRR